MTTSESDSHWVNDISRIAAMIFDRWFFLALFVSTSSILILFNGASGTQGNKIFAGTFFAVSTLALYAFGRWRNFQILACDIIFAAYVALIAVSGFANGWQDFKEVQLLALSLAAYPAGRLFGHNGLKPSFFFVMTAIAAIGSLATAIALFQQWDDPHGKPIVFGFDGAATSFLTSLGFLLIAVACTNMTARKASVVSILIFIPLAIFAASMVRFAFVAICLGIMVSILLSTKRLQRRNALMILCAIIAAVLIGLASRSDKTMVLARYVATASQITTQAFNASPSKLRPDGPMPSCSRPVSLHNSLSIRLGLLSDALHLIRTSGLFGIGLDGFTQFSCVKDSQIHNSLLQASIEFGWIAGALFLALFVVAAANLVPIARLNDEARFVLSCLVFVFLLDMASGRSSREALFFLFAGYAAGFNGKMSITKRADAITHLPAG